MGNIVFNIAKGRVNAYVDRVANNDPASSGLVLVLLTSNVSDAIMQDFDTLADVIADAGNTEANFTNYARKVFTDAEITAPVANDIDNNQNASFPDVTWADAGGTINNTSTKAIVCYAPDIVGAENTLIPLTCHDYVATTNGFDLVLQSTGFFQAD